MRATDAETLALRGLGFLARDPDRLMRFLSATGLRLDDLRARAGEADLLAAVVDFLLAEDALVVEFSASEGLDAKVLHAARRALPGASEP